MKDLRQKLAAIEHERWNHWQRYMHSKCQRNDDGSLTIPADLVERWERQIATPYDELSAREQQPDLQEVDRYWPLIDHYIRETIIGPMSPLRDIRSTHQNDLRRNQLKQLEDDAQP